MALNLDLRHEACLGFTWVRSVFFYNEKLFSDNILKATVRMQPSFISASVGDHREIGKFT